MKIIKFSRKKCKCGGSFDPYELMETNIKVAA